LLSGGYTGRWIKKKDGIALKRREKCERVIRGAMILQDKGLEETEKVMVREYNKGINRRHKDLSGEF